MTRCLRQLVLGVAAVLLLTEAAQAASAQAILVSDTSVRIDLSGRYIDQFCPPTKVWTHFGGTSTGPIVYPNQDNGLIVPDLFDSGSYYFRVRFCVGLDGAGEGIVEFHNTNTVVVPGLPAPQAPGPVEVPDADGGSDYTVTWSAPAGATEYRIAERIHTLGDWSPGSAPAWGDWSAPVSVGNVTSQAYSNDPAVYQYRVIACNFAGACSDAAESPPVIVESQISSGSYYLPDAQIRAIWTAPEGCLVLFDDLPDACESSFSNAHALIPFAHPNHEKMYSQVFMANALGQRIDVWFDDNGSCDSLNTLMTIGRIEIVDGSARVGSNSSKGGRRHD